LQYLACCGNRLVTKVKEIAPGMRDLVVEGRIVEKSLPRLAETRFGNAMVATAILKDETGSITLNLWRDQIDRVKEGDTIRVINAFAKSFGGRTELSIGHDGRIEIMYRAG